MIAAAAAFHVQNVAFGEKESYASLESIGVMAEAWEEHGEGTYTCYDAYNGCWIGGWHIIACWTCSQVRAREFRHQKSCQ